MDHQRELCEIRAQLRHQKRLLRLSFAGWGGGLAILLLAASPGGALQTLQVRRLAVVDQHGVERLILEADNTHANVNEKPLQRSSPISGIILQNAAGDEMGGIGTNSNGDAVMALDSYSSVEPGVVDRVGLVSLANGTAGFKLNDIEMKQRASILSGPDLKAELQIQDQNGAARIRGSVQSDGNGTWQAP